MFSLYEVNFFFDKLVLTANKELIQHRITELTHNNNRPIEDSGYYVLFNDAEIDIGEFICS